MFNKLPETPNNLPERFDHTATGLVGRDDERRKLWGDFSNPRKHFFAIVGPGGLGKTALVLDFLDELTCSVKGQELVDAVVFVSMKTNTLTFTGIVEHAVAKSIGEIEVQVCQELESAFSDSVSTFTEAKKTYADKRLVLCIDNLETLLLEHPNALAPFESQLPEKWRLIVTSRIPADNAVSLPLLPLKPPAAKQLVRQYISSCGYPQPDQSLVDAIVKGTKCNPLAVKLVIDAYVAGSDISESITKAVNDTTEFSFSNLIDVLPEPCIRVMESLFVDDEISRFSLSEALSLTPDEVTKAIYDLCRTSLVTRRASTSGEREIFTLNDQVRELLRFHPKRPEVRERVEKYLRAMRAQSASKSSRTQGGDRYRWDVIEEGLPEDLKAIVHKVNIATSKAKAGNNKLPEIYRQLMYAEGDFASIPTYWRSRARILWRLQDRTAGFECLYKALELDDGDIVSTKLLAEWLIEDQRSNEAMEYLEKIRAKGGDNPEIFGDDFASHFVGSYLYAQIFLRRFEDVASATAKWIERDDGISWVKATARIRCFLRWAEDEASEESLPRFKYALTEFDCAAQHFGLTESLEKLGEELIEEICKRLRLSKQPLPDEFSASFIEFLGKYHQDLVRPDRVIFADFNKTLPIIKDILIRLNTINSRAEVESTEDLAERYVKHGYDIAVIKKPLSFEDRGITSFLFAKDHLGEDYFIHVSSFTNNQRNKWRDLKNGSTVAIKREAQKEGSAKWKALETIFVSS